MASTSGAGTRFRASPMAAGLSLAAAISATNLQFKRVEQMWPTATFLSPIGAATDGAILRYNGTLTTPAWQITTVPLKVQTSLITISSGQLYVTAASVGASRWENDEGTMLGFTSGRGFEIIGRNFARSCSIIRGFNRTSGSGGSYDKLEIWANPLELCPSSSGQRVRLSGETVSDLGDANGYTGQFRILVATYMQNSFGLLPTQSVAGDALAISHTMQGAGAFLTTAVLTAGTGLSAAWMKYGPTGATWISTTGDPPTWFDLAVTANCGTHVFTGIRANVTNTASGSGSSFLDFQLAGTTVFKVFLTGKVTTGSTFNVALGTVTVATLVRDDTVTWNNGAVVFTAWKLNVTNTASAAGSLLLDLQIGGTSQFSVDKAGAVVAVGSITGAALAGTSLTITPGGTLGFSMAGVASTVLANAALSTSATDGFLYVPTCAGAPSGTPTTRTGTVALVYDTTNNKLMVYNGGWKGVTLA